MSGYFWNGKEVLVFNDCNTSMAFEKELYGMDCVDTSCNTDYGRYGQFVTGRGWEGMRPEEFSKEFRMQLLLLGVS